MRLTTVTIAFIFFGTVFATPIFPLRGNPVELSKRTEPEGSTTTGGAAGGDNPPPIRGRKSTRGSTRGRGSSKGKGKVANLQAEEGAASAGSISRSSSSKRKASGDEGSRSTSRKRAKCEPNLSTKEEFLNALRDIDRSKPPSRGSQGFGVYYIKGLVQGCEAVVKIIDRGRLDDDAVKRITGEVTSLRQVEQLFAWGRRAKPELDYILMKNMGVPLSKTKLDLINDKNFIEKKEKEALDRAEAKFHLHHDDPKGHGNYLWDIKNEEDPNMDARYDVNVVDWDGATRIGTHLFAQAPPQYPVPNERDIFGPTKSPESSKGSTPPSNSDDERAGTSHVNLYKGSSGTRTSGRVAEKMGRGTSGTSG
ncbi:hypothetical protein BYT27DRAFT_7245606 [Phlegmacium glaucopus]|nr:hypothetical protein BYT27DRAFT_7245606 [Phlegmacium glaucopus]